MFNIFGFNGSQFDDTPDTLFVVFPGVGLVGVVTRNAVDPERSTVVKSGVAPGFATVVQYVQPT